MFNLWTCSLRQLSKHGVLPGRKPARSTTTPQNVLALSRQTKSALVPELYFALTHRPSGL